MVISSDGTFAIADTAERLLTPREVARLFGVDPKTVNRWADAGRLTFLRTPGGQRRYREGEVHALRSSG
ncbi:BldC family transcriptional regulator [Streptosporangium sp. NPDC051023]|uniref:BldC family transcriptional regulator n=1 Tax=Streptosporangium sp. NPDC051023 TaxID=3155410 RepID=UPI003450D286